MAEKTSKRILVPHTDTQSSRKTSSRHSCSSSSSSSAYRSVPWFSAKFVGATRGNPKDDDSPSPSTRHRDKLCVFQTISHTCCSHQFVLLCIIVVLSGAAVTVDSRSLLRSQDSSLKVALPISSPYSFVAPVSPHVTFAALIGRAPCRKHTLRPSAAAASYGTRSYKRAECELAVVVSPMRGRSCHASRSISTSSTTPFCLSCCRHGGRLVVPFAAALEANGSDSVELHSEAPPQFLIGHGYDIHRLSRWVSPRSLVISGVHVPSEVSPVAHSDGDVVYHSVCDAIFGALSLPDLGEHFPDTDSKWKNQASSRFVREAVELMRRRGYEISNLDTTIVLEKPKLKVLKPEMRRRLAEALQVDDQRVNLKARTHEQVDAIGRQEAIECHTVVLLSRR